MSQEETLGSVTQDLGNSTQQQSQTFLTSFYNNDEQKSETTVLSAPDSVCNKPSESRSSGSTNIGVEANTIPDNNPYELTEPSDTQTTSPVSPSSSSENTRIEIGRRLPQKQYRPPNVPQKRKSPPSQPYTKHSRRSEASSRNWLHKPVTRHPDKRRKAQTDAEYTAGPGSNTKVPETNALRPSKLDSIVRQFGNAAPTHLHTSRERSKHGEFSFHFQPVTTPPRLENPVQRLLFEGQPKDQHIKRVINTQAMVHINASNEDQKHLQSEKTKTTQGPTPKPNIFNDDIVIPAFSSNTATGNCLAIRQRAPGPLRTGTQGGQMAVHGHTSNVTNNRKGDNGQLVHNSNSGHHQNNSDTQSAIKLANTIEDIEKSNNTHVPEDPPQNSGKPINSYDRPGRNELQISPGGEDDLSEDEEFLHRLTVLASGYECICEVIRLLIRQTHYYKLGFPRALEKSDLTAEVCLKEKYVPHLVDTALYYRRQRIHCRLLAISLYICKEKGRPCVFGEFPFKAVAAFALSSLAAQEREIMAHFDGTTTDPVTLSARSCCLLKQLLTWANGNTGNLDTFPITQYESAHHFCSLISPEASSSEYVTNGLHWDHPTKSENQGSAEFRFTPKFMLPELFQICTEYESIVEDTSDYWLASLESAFFFFQQTPDFLDQAQQTEAQTFDFKISLKGVIERHVNPRSKKTEQRKESQRPGKKKQKDDMRDVLRTIAAYERNQKRNSHKSKRHRKQEDPKHRRRERKRRQRSTSNSDSSPSPSSSPSSSSSSSSSETSSDSDSTTFSSTSSELEPKMKNKRVKVLKRKSKNKRRRTPPNILEHLKTFHNLETPYILEDAQLLEETKLGKSWPEIYATERSRIKHFKPEKMNPKKARYQGTVREALDLLRVINHGDERSQEDHKNIIRTAIRYLDSQYQIMHKDRDTPKREIALVRGAYYFGWRYLQYLQEYSEGITDQFAPPPNGTNDTPNFKTISQIAPLINQTKDPHQIWKVLIHYAKAEDLSFKGFKQLTPLVVPAPLGDSLKHLVDKAKSPKQLATLMSKHFSDTLIAIRTQALDNPVRHNNEKLSLALTRYQHHIDLLATDNRQKNKRNSKGKRLCPF